MGLGTQSQIVSVEISFLDAGGKQWRRKTDGTLEELYEPR